MWLIKHRPFCYCKKNNQYLSQSEIMNHQVLCLVTFPLCISISRPKVIKGIYKLVKFQLVSHRRSPLHLCETMAAVRWYRSPSHHQQMLEPTAAALLAADAQCKTQHSHEASKNLKRIQNSKPRSLSDTVIKRNYENVIVMTPVHIVIRQFVDWYPEKPWLLRYKF